MKRVVEGLVAVVSLLLCSGTFIYAYDLSCVEVFQTDYSHEMNSLHHLFGEVYYNGNGKILYNADVDYFKSRLGYKVEDIWNSTGRINSTSYNPLDKLSFQAGAEDLEESTNAIPSSEYERYGVWNTDQEYLFFVYVRQFVRHIIKGTVYQQPESTEAAGSLIFNGNGRISQNNLIFNDNYSITKYAEDTWRWVMSKSIFADRFPTGNMSCLRTNTLVFVALYTLLGTYDPNISGMSESEIVSFKDELVEKLTRAYNCVDYLNRLYIISFIAFSGIDLTYSDVAQRVKDDISMYQYTPSEGVDPTLIEREKLFFKDAIKTLQIDEFKKYSYYQPHGYSAPPIFRCDY